MFRPPPPPPPSTDADGESFIKRPCLRAIQTRGRKSKGGNSRFVFVVVVGLIWKINIVSGAARDPSFLLPICQRELSCRGRARARAAHRIVTGRRGPLREPFVRRRPNEFIGHRSLLRTAREPFIHRHRLEFLSKYHS